MMDDYGSGGVEMFDTWIIFGDPSLKISGPAGMQVDPSGGLAASGPPGGPYDAQSLNYTVTNNNAAPIDFEATGSQPWVSIANPTGTIPAGGTATVTVVISDASRNLDIGSHSDTVRFRNLTNRSGDTTRPVVLKVSALVPVLRWTLGSDPGWSSEGEWQFGVPSGSGGGKGMNPDPAAGATGANVFGANLAGNISKTMGGPYYLTAGPFDLAGVNGATLAFQRWLNTPDPADVASTVAVSDGGSAWTTVWTNSGLVTDAAWTPQTFDISSLTGGGGAVYMRWGYQVKGRVSTAGSGWNIDDVELQGALQSARITLSVVMDQLSWTSLPGMAGYDVVRGDLRTLATSGGDFTAATNACLGENVAGTTLPNTPEPSPGEGHWFLVRGVSLSGPMTYQSLAGDQIGLRDAEINAAAASCQ